MNILQDSLYWLTSGLLIPCIAFLLFMLIQCLIAAGKQFSISHRQAKALTQLTNWVRSESISDSKVPQDCKVLESSNVVEQIINSKDIAFNRLLVTRFEAEMGRLLNRFAHFAKLGPVTGLVGTLIPMGPALQGLADGNIQQLAGQMQVAFTTTVIGLIVGGIGFILYQINKRQIVLELSLLDYLLDREEG